ncbi:CRAL-TRIO domain-containing protein [Lophiotrema nucula]|uniref:Phosphatidylinositol transfer protein SFH5 n=1 Tax=Lophiotrema nucula TaxID=690887 RepID=A0A6A5Z8P2_9PLEO|nr:CRAL-TRIO domain-containing protein [Lophiotrema nucula]
MSAEPVAAAPVAEPSEKKVEPVAEAPKAEPTATTNEEKKVEEATAAVAAAPVPATESSTEKDLEKTEPSEKKVEEATAAVAAAPLPASNGPSDATATALSGEPAWPETPADHPLAKFFEEFEELVKQAEYDEVYGIKLSKSEEFKTKLILQKFLRANANDLVKAKEQLLDTLKFRKEFKPLDAVNEKFEKERFEGLGFITEVEDVPESVNKKDIVTFNIYGAVKDNKKTFGDLDGFLRWRVALMERSVHRLNLSSATKPIPNYNEGPDPYQGFQVHDYLQVSFLRQDPAVKAATKKTVETLGRFYPETLSRKFFVNVPVVMQWVYTAVKLFVAKETQKKFVVVSYGNQLAAELGSGLPKEYGGTKRELKGVGETLGSTE